MDDDDQRELDELRRRAYGPGGERLAPAELARLEELEGRARALAAGHSAQAPPDEAAGAPGGDDRREERAASDTQVEAARVGDTATAGVAGGADDGDSAAAPTGVATRRRRLFATGAAVLAVALLAAIVVPRLVDSGPSLRRSEPGPLSTPTGILATPESVHRALRYAEDPEVESILTIQLGRALSLPTPEPVPDLPVEGDAAWIETVGDYYGQRVWLARAASDEVCLLVEGATVTRGACLDEDEFEMDALLITVPYLEVPADDRPDAMAEGDALSFWWRSDDRLAVLVGPSPFAVD